MPVLAEHRLWGGHTGDNLVLQAELNLRVGARRWPSVAAPCCAAPTAIMAGAAHPALNRFRASSALNGCWAARQPERSRLKQPVEKGEQAPRCTTDFAQFTETLGASRRFPTDW
jgi:hypothetical protein